MSIHETFKERFAELKSTDKRVVAKAITKLVVRHSVSGVMVTIIHNTCPTFSKAQKVQLYVGAWAVGGVVSDHAADWAAHRVDDYIDLFKTVADISDENSPNLSDDPIPEFTE